MKKRLGRNMALIGTITASLSLIIMAYSANILFGILISGILIMAFGIGIMLEDTHKND